MVQLDRLKIQLQITTTRKIAFAGIVGCREVCHPLPPLSTASSLLMLLEACFTDRYLNTVGSLYIYNKIGAEGQISHSENGISRGYEPGIFRKAF